MMDYDKKGLTRRDRSGALCAIDVRKCGKRKKLANGFKTIAGAGNARPRGFAVRRGFLPLPAPQQGKHQRADRGGHQHGGGRQAGQIQGQKPVVEQML